jgi:hypothetical protein
MDTSKIDLYISIGRHDKLWYEKAESLFVELYGRDELSMVTQLFAATSINTSMKSNITLFRRAYHEIKQGLPFSNYLPSIRRQLEQLRAGESLTGMKINAFARAMTGDTDAVVVDVWLLRAFGMERRYMRKVSGYSKEFKSETETFRERSGGASPKDFKLIEAWVRQRAKELNYTPRQLSAIIWSGVRIALSGDRETHYDLILRNKEFNMFEYGKG